jgi:hypothetical protein
MSKRPAPLKFVETPSIDAGRRKDSRDAVAGTDDVEMLAGRVNGVVARQFRAYAKLKGGKVQTYLEQAVAEFLERNRV